LQPLLPKDIHAAPYQALYTNMLSGLSEAAQSEEGMLSISQAALPIVKSTLEALRETLINQSFKSPEEEIFFFKQVKPVFYCHWIFWLGARQMELHRPPGNKPVQEKYFLGELQKLQNFFDEHVEFYLYYRRGSCMLDDIYFLREKQDINIASTPYQINMDRQFSTSHDYLVAKILASDMLSGHINNILMGLDSPMLPVLPVKHNICWTAPKVGLAELLYALHAAGVFNNSQIEIKKIADFFSSQMNVNLGNVYKTLEEIRLRKKNRTAFLDMLRQHLIRRMDEDDERAF